VIRRLLVILFIGSVFSGEAQDIPLFSQKLTNSFIYNPSFAGLGFGSFTFSHRRNYSGVQGAPVNNFLSLHTPFAGGRFGIGANVFQEDVNILKNTYASAAFAYHISFNKYSKLSFGVSGELNTLRLNGADVNFEQVSQDLVLDNLRTGKNNSYDFSFGTSYNNQYIKLGLALNRMSTAWLKPDSTKLLSNYYSGFAQGNIRLRGGQDLLEPYVAYRKFSETNNTWDAGLFYTYNDKISAGAATRKGGVYNFTVAYHLSKNLMIGYSREMITQGIGGFVGASNEFTIRLDFNNQASKVKFRDDYKSSLSYRRKTLTTSAARRTTSGGKNPKQLHKAQKRVAAYSPNRRYQNNAKLSHGKKAPMRKSYNNVKKKPKKSPHKSPSRKSTTKKYKPKKYPSSKRRR
jgi:type IX secretion system PorP/SprF family membrane protein